MRNPIAFEVISRPWLDFPPNTRTRTSFDAPLAVDTLAAAMGFYVASGLGDSIDAPSEEQMRNFLADVDEGDQEHGGAWLTTDTGYSLQWSGVGLVFSRPLTEGPPRHLPAASREQALELWMALANDNISQVERCAWKPWTGRVPDPEWRAKTRALLLKQDRAFYDMLGPEREEVPCRREACERGAVAHSVLCRAHHFESIKGRPSPFTD